MNNDLVFNSPMKYYGEFMMIKNINDLDIGQTANNDFIQYFTEFNNIKDFYIQNFREGMDILDGYIKLTEVKKLILKNKI